MRLNRHFVVLVLVVAVIALVASACSVDSGDSNDAGDAASTNDASGGSDAGRWCADDSAEPNDDHASAAVVPLPFHGTISGPDDVDVFRFFATRADATKRLIVASALASDGNALELVNEVACDPVEVGAALVCRQGEEATTADGVICTSETTATVAISAEASADCDAASAFITVRATAAGIMACAPYTVTATSYDVAANP